MSKVNESRRDESNKTILLMLLPFWTPLIPPLGISCLKSFLISKGYKVKNYDELKEILKTKGGILQACWCGGRGCEDKIKEETGTKIINIPFEQEKIFSDCVVCGKKAKCIANIAKSY
jgi:hypothetical protein